MMGDCVTEACPEGERSKLCLSELETESPEIRVRTWLDALSSGQKFSTDEVHSVSTVEYTEGCTSIEGTVNDSWLKEVDCANKRTTEQESKADNSSGEESSSSQDYSVGTTYGRPYTDDECEAMIMYIMDNEAHSLVKGSTLWKKMQAEKVCERSWQSMSTYFRKKIIPNIGQYRLQEKEAEKFLDLLRPCTKKASTTIKPGERGWRRNTNFYVKEDDQKILEFLLRKNRFCSVGGNVLWKNMENKSIVQGRSWQSMKSRYLNIILPRIKEYNLSEDCVNKLKQKKEYGKLKKETKKPILNSPEKPMNKNSESKSFISGEKQQDFRKRAVLTGISLAEQLRQTKAMQLAPQNPSYTGLPLKEREAVSSTENKYKMTSNCDKNSSQVHKHGGDVSELEEVSMGKKVSKKKLYMCVTKLNGNAKDITTSTEPKNTSVSQLNVSSAEMTNCKESTMNSAKRKHTIQQVPTKYLCQNDGTRVPSGESEGENEEIIFDPTVLSSQKSVAPLKPTLLPAGGNQIKKSVDLVCQVEESEGYATDHEEDVNAERHISETSPDPQASKVLVSTKSGVDRRENGGVSSVCGFETSGSFQHCGSVNNSPDEESNVELEGQLCHPLSLKNHRNSKNQDSCSPMLPCAVQSCIKVTEGSVEPNFMLVIPQSSPGIELDFAQKKCIEQQPKDNIGKQSEDNVNLCVEVYDSDTSENFYDEHTSSILTQRLDGREHNEELKVSQGSIDSKVLKGIISHSSSSHDDDTPLSPRYVENVDNNQKSEHTDAFTNSPTSKNRTDSGGISKRGVGSSFVPSDSLYFCEGHEEEMNTTSPLGRQYNVDCCKRQISSIEDCKVAHASSDHCTFKMQTCDVTGGQENSLLDVTEENKCSMTFSNNYNKCDLNYVNTNPRIPMKEVVICEKVPHDPSMDSSSDSSKDSSGSSYGALQLYEDHPPGTILENKTTDTSLSKPGPIHTSTPKIFAPISEKILSPKPCPNPNSVLECDGVELNANSTFGASVGYRNAGCPSVLPELTCQEKMTESEESFKICASSDDPGQRRVCGVGRHDSSVHSASTELYSDSNKFVEYADPYGDLGSDTSDTQYKLVLSPDEHLGGNSILQASTESVQLSASSFHNSKQATNEDVSADQDLNLLISNNEEDPAEELVLRLDDSGGESPTQLPCYSGDKQLCGGCSRCYQSMSPVSD